MSDWEQVLVDNPKILWGLVADIVKAAKANDGEKRTGRRPAATVANLEELYEVLFPVEYAAVPFGEAFARLLATAGRSQRQFAMCEGISQPTVHRLITGSSLPSVEMVERIARALNVRPTYFAEYRAAKVGQILTDFLLANAELSAEVVRYAIIGARS